MPVVGGPPRDKSFRGRATAGQCVVGIRARLPTPQTIFESSILGLTLESPTMTVRSSLPR